MKRRLNCSFRPILIVLMLLVAGGVPGLFAQEGGAAATVEELYLQSGARAEVVGSMVTSNDRATQMSGIRLMVKAAEEGSMDPDATEYVEIAAFALRQGATEVGFRHGVLPSVYHPMIRVEAARALSLSGHREARLHLVDAIRNDPEGVVRAEAMQALAAQDRSRPNEMLLEIALALREEANVGRDRYVLVSGMEAMKEIGRRADLESLDPLVHQVLVEIASSGLNQIVRERAVSTLTSL